MQVSLSSEEVLQRRSAARMVLWLYLVSMAMMFAGLTSAYIVKRVEGPWRSVEVPSFFYLSTGVLVLSSLTLHWSLQSARRDNMGRLQAMLGATLGLGIIFIFLQLAGFSQLVGQQVHLVGNPGESFVYILTGLHGLHVVAAILLLVAMLVQSLRLRISAQRHFGLGQTVTFWHALGLLWLYLFLFLLANQA